MLAETSPGCDQMSPSGGEEVKVHPPSLSRSRDHDQRACECLEAFSARNLHVNNETALTKYIYIYFYILGHMGVFSQMELVECSSLVAVNFDDVIDVDMHVHTDGCMWMCTCTHSLLDLERTKFGNHYFTKINT